MSHYHAEIWVPEDKDIGGAITTILAPHEEKYDEGEDTVEGFWDWYQIGGRWSGVHVPDYQPETDPSNIEHSKICGGTGFRHDGVGKNARAGDPTYTCNGCGTYNGDKKCWQHGECGPGKKVKWPSEWRRFEGDVLPVKNVPDDLECYTLIVNGQVFHTSEWGGDKFRDTDFDGRVMPKLQELGLTSGHLVTVDYHS